MQADQEARWADLTGCTSDVCQKIRVLARHRRYDSGAALQLCYKRWKLPSSSHAPWLHSAQSFGKPAPLLNPISLPPISGSSHIRVCHRHSYQMITPGYDALSPLAARTFYTGAYERFAASAHTNATGAPVVAILAGAGSDRLRSPTAPDSAASPNLGRHIEASIL